MLNAIAPDLGKPLHKKFFVAGRPLFARAATGRPNDERIKGGPDKGARCNERAISVASIAYWTVRL
jgi:hypothetical protein